MVTTDTDGVLSFARRENNWLYYLDLDGEPFYLVGNRCDTCNALFERARNLKTPIAPAMLSHQLQQGLTLISDDLLATVAPLLPHGYYFVSLLDLEVELARKADKRWIRGVSCEADYFWWHVLELTEKSSQYELVLPAMPESDLSAERIADYRTQLQQGEHPTALALTLSDYRTVMGQYPMAARAHFLLDGHHNVMAASQAGLPIRLLSFMYSWENSYDIPAIKKYLARRAIRAENTRPRGE